MKIINVLITTALLVLLTVTSSIAADYKEISLELHGWINEARSNPMRYIREFNIDEERARQALGERQWVLDRAEGLPQIPSNFDLSSSADAHNRDMLEKLYFAYDSPDGRTPAERMTEYGCLAENKGEVIGAIILYMYIDPQKAVESMFRYMVSDELNPDTETEINIFNPELSAFGLSFLGGQITIAPGTIANVYLLVADFAHSPCEGPAFYPPAPLLNPVWQ